MILIPEIETVVILVPRTASGALRRALIERYPRAIQIYRHMEADGVPHGYDRWQKVGVVRNPLHRLWSLYKFLRSFSGDHDPSYIAAMRNSADRPFEEWLLHNQTVFTSPYDSANRGRYWPQFTVRHALPENRKSQFVYLRPDLGTEVHCYDEIDRLAFRLNVSLRRHNESDAVPMPDLSEGARAYTNLTFKWDFDATSTRRSSAA